MIRPFAMLVESAIEAAPPVLDGVLLSGPTLGPAPQAGALLTARGALGLPRRGRFESIGAFHRSRSMASPLVLVTGLQGSPQDYVGSIVYDEGVLFRVFSGYLGEQDQHHVRGIASFELEDGRAQGFVTVQGRLLNAFVLGGGLPEASSLWERIRRLQCADVALNRDEIRPLPDAWAVPLLPGYQRRSPVLLARMCGPATPGVQAHALAFPEHFSTLEVLDQQPSSGLVQLELAGPDAARPVVAWASERTERLALH